MDVQRRVFGECAQYFPKTDTIQFNINSFISRLLIFDNVILDSIRLKEIRYLIEAFGINGFFELIKSNILQLHCYGFSVGQIYQQRMRKIRNGLSNKILGPYLFELVRESESKRNENLELLFRDEIDTIDQLTKNEKVSLKNELQLKIISPPREFGFETFDSFLSELKVNSGMIESSIKYKVKQMYGIDLPDFYLKIHHENEKKVFIETSLNKLLKKDNIELDNVIQYGILGISSIWKRIEEMKLYSALSGFKEQEISLFDEKLKGLERYLSSKETENRFRRILSINGFPEIVVGKDRINVKELLKIKETDEFAQFREWLPRTDALEEIEIKDILDGMTARISRIYNSKTVGVIKFFILGGLSLMPPPIPIAALGLSALDEFVLKNILIKQGPVSFIHDLYPSIFKAKIRDGQ